MAEEKRRLAFAGDYLVCAELNFARMLCGSIMREMRFNHPEKIVLGAVLALVVIPFLISRWPFLFHYFLPHWNDDSQSYIEPMLQLQNSQWPLFDVRTPAYPLLMYAMFMTGAGFGGVVCVQMLVSLLSACLLALTFLRAYGQRAGLLTALVMGVFVSQDVFVEFDASIKPESLYTSTIILCVSCLVFIAKDRSKDHVTLFSVLAAIAIWLKPAAIFLCVTAVFIFIFLLRAGASKMKVCAMLTPLPALLLLLCVYNKGTIDHFAISPYGNVSLVGVTNWYWETHPTFPAEVNTSIRQHRQSIDPADRQIMESRWDRGALGKTFQKYFEYSHFHGPFRRHLKDYAIQGEVAKLAIQSHPEYFIKNAYVQAVQFFLNFSTEIDVYSFWAGHFRKMALENYGPTVEHHDADPYGISDDMKKYPLTNYALVQGGNAYLRPQFSQRIHDYWRTFLNVLFQNPVWIVGYLLAFLLSLYACLKDRFREPLSFLAFSLLSMHFGSAVLVSLVAISWVRYSFPTQFACLLIVPLAYVAYQKRLSKKAPV